MSREKIVLGEGYPCLTEDYRGDDAVQILRDEDYSSDGNAVEVSWPGDQMKGRYRLVLEPLEDE